MAMNRVLEPKSVRELFEEFEGRFDTLHRYGKFHDSGVLELLSSPVHSSERRYGYEWSYDGLERHSYAYLRVQPDLPNLAFLLEMSPEFAKQQVREYASIKAGTTLAWYREVLSDIPGEEVLIYAPKLNNQFWDLVIDESGIWQFEPIFELEDALKVMKTGNKYAANEILFVPFKPEPRFLSRKSLLELLSKLGNIEFLQGFTNLFYDFKVQIRNEKEYSETTLAYRDLDRPLELRVMNYQPKKTEQSLNYNLA